MSASFRGPFTKEMQVGAGRPRRYRRKIAGPKQWQAIVAEKGDRCRLCEAVSEHLHGQPVEYHHLVSRGSQLGDDVADNIVPVCRLHHHAVTARHEVALRLLAESLTDAEYAYCIDKLGEGAMERLFGVEYRP